MAAKSSAGARSAAKDDAEEVDCDPDDADGDAAEFADAVSDHATEVEVDTIEAQIEECNTPARGSDDGVCKKIRKSAMDDPTLIPPAHSKADWGAEMQRLRALVEDGNNSDEEAERIRLLHEALSLRIEDTRVQEDHKAAMQRRLDDALKEKERCGTEVQRSLQLKSKLEGSCREMQHQKISIAKENQRIAEEEQNRHTELKEKFQQAIKDVQEKMDAELEVRQHFLKENEELRGKLLKFTETYEAQEQQLAEQRTSRQQEMEVVQTRLKEHETMCSESKIKTAQLDKQNEALRKSQTVLRDELQSILGKFDEFHEAVTGSNQRHGDCKVEIDALQTRLTDLEKENSDLKENKLVTELTEEQKVACKQRDALEKLCDNLQKENKKHTEALKQLKRESQLRG